jgi:hypothetical protein
MNVKTPVRLRMGVMEMDGAAPGDQARLQAAVRRELQRLIARGGIDGAAEPGDAGQVRAGPGTSVDALAARIARGAYARMRQRASPAPVQPA